jgi:hypothetical protein
VRRLEQAEQGCRLLLGTGLGVEVVARQVGKTELVLGGKFPGQVEVDVLRQLLGGSDQLGRRRFLEAQQHVGRLGLHALAGFELDLHRALGFRHHAPGQELAGVIEQCIGHGRDCRLARDRQRIRIRVSRSGSLPLGGTGPQGRRGRHQTVMPPETSITAPLT